MYGFGLGKPTFRFWLGAPGAPPGPEPQPPPIEGAGPGRGTGKIKREPYRREYEDVLRETRLRRIKQDDQELIDLITILITKGIL